jgi:hypothetical protein
MHFVEPSPAVHLSVLFVLVAAFESDTTGAARSPPGYAIVHSSDAGTAVESWFRFIVSSTVSPGVALADDKAREAS